MPGDLRWWRLFESTGGPSPTGIVKREQLTNVIELLHTKIEKSRLLKVFQYLENFSGRGAIELPDLVNFLECPLSARDVIRSQMNTHLAHPHRFVRYRTFI